jgi:2-methylcitrate dehydratase PrpD
MSKPYFAGHSAHGGVLSALLASNGFTSADDCFEGAQGTFATFSPGVDMSAAVEGLGSRWELAENAFKVHASCAMSHAIVDGILALRERHALHPGAVAALRLCVFPHAAEYLDRPRVDNGLQGKFSAQYCAAAALLDGSVQEMQFTDARAADPALHGAMARVALVPDARYRMDQARVEIALHSGERHVLEVLAVSGSPAKPIGLAGLQGKCLQLATRVLGAERGAGLLQSIHGWPQGSVPGLLQQTIPAN